MPLTKPISSLSNVKQLTGADSPQNPGSLVTYTYGPASSTSGQTVINLGFAVSTSNTANFFLWVDGKLLSLGSSNDYTFTNVQSNGTSSQVTLNQTLAAGLNINAVYLGVLIPNAASTSILTLNAALAALNNYSLKTTNYTLGPSDVVVQFNCSTGNLIATLPSAVTATVGQRFEIVRYADATPNNTLTVNTTSSQTIQGRASGSIILSPSDYLIVVSDGANWQIAEIKETMACTYTSSSTNTTGSDTFTTLIYGGKEVDTHSAYNTSTGIWTAPCAGEFVVSASASQSIPSGGTGQGAWLVAQQGGSSARQVIIGPGWTFGINTTYSASGAQLFQCAAGDTLKIQWFNGSGSGTAGGQAALSIWRMN